MNNEHPRGYVSLILHAHLPFVRHLEHGKHMEEVWLYEAITDTYLPLLNVLNGWVQDGIPFALTISLTPTLTSMLADPLLQQRYVEHLDRMVALAHDQSRFHNDNPDIVSLTQGYKERFEQARYEFVRRYDGNILRAFQQFIPHGLHIMASAATHGFLPLMEPVTSAAQAQIRAGIHHHEVIFGQRPTGFWLPECGYHPQHDALLTEEGIRFTVVDTHGMIHAVPRPRYDVYAPVYSPHGLAIFGRDTESSKQVWSADEGYPGDYDYREFYRDAGHDLPWEQLSPYNPWGVRVDTGLKYYRITGDGPHKDFYDPERAREKARLHAANFVFNREHQIRHLAAHMDRPPIVVSPYDAELFGHWWFEGPLFVDQVMRRFAHSRVATPITPDAYLNLHPQNQRVDLSHSTWGYKGFAEMWLTPANDWIYRHLHHASKRMEHLVNQFADGPPNDIVRRALNQAMRELFLAQSSDWAFIMKSGTVVEYAQKRTLDHLRNFLRLDQELSYGDIHEPFLMQLEATHNLLPYLDYRQMLRQFTHSRNDLVGHHSGTVT